LNAYYVVEDRRSGKQVYRAWIKHCFPDLAEVQSMDEMRENHFYIISGHGYPSYIQRISAALQDIERTGNIDHLFICIDTEDMSIGEKHDEIVGVLNEGPAFFNSHVIVHNCCMETWFLGHDKMLKRYPQDDPLRSWKNYYDVSRLDPELMECPSGSTIKAQFHYDYLRAMLHEQNLRYTKNTPGPMVQPQYLAALINRHRNTGHIATFGKLLDIWESLGAANISSS
jgi:hypothetical protein